jgi:hypothetical protein
MGDSGIGFEALSTGDCRLFRSSARNWPLRLLGLLQQYRHLSDMAIGLLDVCLLGESGHRIDARQRPSSVWCRYQKPLCDRSE